MHRANQLVIGAFTCVAAVTWIGNLSFWCCENLEAVYFLGNAPRIQSSSWFGLLLHGCGIGYVSLAGRIIPPVSTG